MQIWIRSSDKIVELTEVESIDTVQALKERIRNIDGVPVECQRLTCAGQELKNSRVLADYNLRSQNSNLLLAASASGAGKVAQMLRENRTIDLEVVPLTLYQKNHESGDLDAFIKENTARTACLRARHRMFQDHQLLSVPNRSVSEVATSNVGVSVAAPASSPRKLSAMKCPGSPALSCASLATRASSEDGSEAPSLPSSPSSPCASPGLSLEIEMPKVAFQNAECFSLDAFTRENSACSARLLKRLHERRVADGF